MDEIDDAVAQVLKAAAHSGSLDPTKTNGMTFWKSENADLFWDQFDAKSYAFFLLAEDINSEVGYADQISLSLSRRVNGDQQSFDAAVKEIFAAKKDVIADFQRIHAKNKGVMQKLHTFGSNAMQIRWVDPE